MTETTVTAAIELLDLYTGETKWIQYEDSSYDIIRYQWDDGNYSCDCNRWREFFGEDAPAADDFCGEPRIRARSYMPGCVSFNDWPEECQRARLAEDLKRNRAIIRQRPEMAL